MSQPMTYADTAYDSTRPRDLPPPIPDDERSFTMKGWRRFRLNALPIECGEYLPLADVSEVESLRDDKSQKRLANNLEPLTLAWGGMANPLYWVGMAYIACTVFSFGIIASALLVFVISFHHSFHKFVETLEGYIPLLIVAVVLFTLRYFLSYLIKHDKIANRNNTVFDRRTGLVHLPAGGGQAQSIPFDELAPYEYTTVSNYGKTYYHLMLGHKYSDAFAVYSRSHDEPWFCHLEWEFYQQFMDVSMPLPDVPSLEPWRALDPTTIEWDKRMSRPPDFWKNSPKGGYSNLSSEASDVTESFVWGSSSNRDGMATFPLRQAELVGCRA